jgi:hypothetical protein
MAYGLRTELGSPSDMGYHQPGTGTVYLHCAMCARPFRTFRYRLREGAKFCSMRCCWAAQRAFTKALADGRLELILAEERERAKRAAMC